MPVVHSEMSSCIWRPLSPTYFTVETRNKWDLGYTAREGSLNSWKETWILDPTLLLIRDTQHSVSNDPEGKPHWKGQYRMSFGTSYQGCFGWDIVPVCPDRVSTVGTSALSPSLGGLILESWFIGSRETKELLLGIIIIIPHGTDL